MTTKKERLEDEFSRIMGDIGALTGTLPMGRTEFEARYASTQIIVMELSKLIVSVNEIKDDVRRLNICS